VTIHPLAAISNQAEIHSGVEIGPFCTVEAGAVIGQDCRLASRVTVKRGTTLGRGVVVGEGSVLGGLPQLATPVERAGTAIIGERCTLRENVTVHCSMYPDGQTRIGSDCLLMVGAHVAHDCRVGSRAILTNNVLLGGHVKVGERACLGGAVAVHQYCRIGKMAMIGGCARVVQDVPPFMLTDGETALIVGLNRVGLRRAGIDRSEIASLKEAYRVAYRRGLPFEEMVQTLEALFPTGLAGELASFYRGSQRGFVQERRSPPSAAIRIHPAAEKESLETRRLAG
jgi:UDP-N-acetylglucosamine acyltransferase